MAPLARARRGTRSAHDPDRRLVRDDGRAALRAARAQRRPPPLATAPRPRRADREREPALPAAARAALRARLCAGVAPPRAPRERVRDGVRLLPRLPAHPPRDRQPARRLRGRAPHRLPPVAALRRLPAHRGRRLPGLPLGDPRDRAVVRGAVAPNRPAADPRPARRDLRPHAVRRARRRTAGRVLPPRAGTRRPGRPPARPDGARPHRRAPPRGRVELRGRDRGGRRPRSDRPARPGLRHVRLGGAGRPAAARHRPLAARARRRAGARARHPPVRRRDGVALAHAPPTERATTHMRSPASPPWRSSPCSSR